MRIAVFASGTGSNFIAIYNSIKKSNIDLEINALITNDPGSGAKEFADANGIRSFVINEKRYPGEVDSTILKVLIEKKINLIVLAGYMKMIGRSIVEKYKNKILNIHPALLPSFGGKGMYGIHVHEAVINSGSKFTGVTIHLVDNKYDTGPIVMQKVIPVLDDDTPGSLQKRVLKVEHKLYFEVIKLFYHHKISITGRRVRILN